MRFLKAVLILVFFSVSLFADDFKQAGDLYFQGKQEQALKEFSKLADREFLENAYLNAAFIATELGRRNIALKILKKGVKKNPNSLNLKRELAKSFIANEEYKKARNIYLEIIEKKLNTSKDYFNLARTELSENYLLHSEAYLNRAILLDNDNYLAYFFLGKVYEELKDMSFAITAYGKVLKKDSQFILAKRKLASLYLKKGNPKVSFEHYKKISYALPSNAAIKKRTAKVKAKLEFAPKEIILPKGTIKYRTVKKITIPAKIPTLKIALSSSTDGLPVVADKIYFSSSCDFTLKSQDEISAKGVVGKIWGIELAKDSKTAVVSNNKGKTVLNFDKSIKLITPKDKSCTVILHSSLFEHATSWAKREDREYRGEMEFVLDAARKTLATVNHISLEEYLYSVLPCEMPDIFPKEALRAQAVLARTYALRTMKNNSYFNLCDSQKCQVYKGVTNEAPKTTLAVNDTQGLILTFDDKPIYAVFSSNCGGITQYAKDVWGNEFPYLKPRLDYKKVTKLPVSPYEFKQMFTSYPESYCGPSSFVYGLNYRWARFVSAKDILKRVKRKKDIGRLLAVLPKKRSRSGHLLEIVIKGTKGSYLLDTPAKIKNYLAFGRLKSTSFIIEPYFKNKSLDYLLIYGAGWGHSVGFCQSGAGGRAKEGWKYKDILKHYFPGTKLKSLI